MAEHQVLFCPFCGESFEGHSCCPDHDLPLVRFDQLKSHGHGVEGDDDPYLERPDERLAMLDLRFGRGVVAAGALLGLIVPGLEVAHKAGLREGLSFGVGLASAPSLGTIPLVGATLLWIVGRRRTRRGLLGLRVLVPMLGLLWPAAFVHAFLRLRALYPSPAAEPGLVPDGRVVALLLAGSVLVVWGGARLGRPRVGSV